MPVIDERLADAWRAASEALGVEILAPYSFEWKGDVFDCLAFVPLFGGTKGTVVEALHEPGFDADPRLRAAAQEAGYFVSSVNTEAYSTYDKQLFVETLQDWGYFGPAEQAPPWLKMPDDTMGT